MLKIHITPDLRAVAPAITLGCLEAEVQVHASNTELFADIAQIVESHKKTLTVELVAQQKPIKDARDVYRKLGKDPTRYRLASDSLVRRILKGMELYEVNNVVDINNLISLKSFFPLGAYDLEKIGQEIIFRPGFPGESYEGIGRGPLNLENLPVFADEQGSFASPTSDSERSMVTMESQRILLNIISFSGEDGLNEWLDYGERLLARYAEGRNFRRMIVTGK